MATAKKPSVVTPKKKYDNTSSQRAENHLARLAERGGKRLPIDFEADNLNEIEELVNAGYGDSRAGVIRKAITEVHQRHVAKKKAKAG